MSNQLRANLRYTLFTRIRVFVNRIMGVNLGNKVHLSANIKFLRNKRRIHISNDVVIKEGCRICACNEKSKIEIGARTTIGYHTFIFSSSLIKIGSDCMIAPFVYIVDSDHGIDRASKMNAQSNISEEIVIGDDVWIGAGVKILKGVVIGNGAIVAAGAVVNSHVQEFSIVGGIPARLISERK